ncbi:hypothetical protein [Corynebacterium fournieri]|uniref:hypothetical protein n=1 Tax=Corynebacterium fournieri TaxID=1852390 RepID=UPI000A2F2583|nr:hypothetical protein [Corynebacterium fournieri]WJY97179.1 hypothetical protein CFOUR_03750 [Corynebacterium fournieri]
MLIQLDVDGVESAIEQLRKQALALKTQRHFSSIASLASFSTASGLDEAGERLSPIGDERAPEANQAIALYLKHTADNLWLALTNTMQTDESFSGLLGSMLAPLRNSSAEVPQMYSEAFQQLKAADPKTNTFDNAAVSGASESSLMFADQKLTFTNTDLAYAASDFWTANATLIEDAVEELNGVHHALSSSADTVWIAEAMKKVTQIQNAGLEYVSNSRSLANHTQALAEAADAESMISSAAVSAYLAAEDPKMKALIESDYLSSYETRMTSGLSTVIPSFNRLLPEAGALPSAPYSSTDIPAPADTSFEPTPLPQGLREAFSQRGLTDLAHASTPTEIIEQYGRPTPETFERIAAGAAPTQSASAVMAPPAPSSAGSLTTNGTASPNLSPAPVAIGGAGHSVGGTGTASTHSAGPASAFLGGPGAGAAAGQGTSTGANRSARAGAVGNNGLGPVAGPGGAAGAAGTSRAGGAGTGLGGHRGALAGAGMHAMRPGAGGAGFGAGSGANYSTTASPGAGHGTGPGSGHGLGNSSGAHGAGGSSTATGATGAGAQHANGAHAARGAAFAAGPMGAAGANRGRGREKSGGKIGTVTSAVERDGNLKALLGDAPLLLPDIIGHNVRR